MDNDKQISEFARAIVKVVKNNIPSRTIEGEIPGNEILRIAVSGCLRFVACIGVILKIPHNTLIDEFNKEWLTELNMQGNMTLN